MAYASVAIVLDKEGKILFLKRSNKVNSYKGFWCLPGGRVEPNEDPAKAVSRELQEETSLRVSEDDIEFIVSSLSGQRKKINFYLIKKWSGQIDLNWESDNSRWFDTNNLPLENMIPMPVDLIQKIKQKLI